MEEITSMGLRRLHGRLGRVAYQLTQLSFSRFSPPSPWHPSLNAFLCDGHVRICLELAGVEASSVHLRVESRRLHVTGKRQVPEPCGTELQARQILAMEIDYGPFERAVELPFDVEASRSKIRQENGLLWIELPLRTEA